MLAQYIQALRVTELALDEYRTTYYTALFLTKGVSKSTHQKRLRCATKILNFCEAHPISNPVILKLLQTPITFTVLEAGLCIFLTFLVINDQFSIVVLFY